MSPVRNRLPAPGSICPAPLHFCVRAWVSNTIGSGMTFEQFKTNVENWQEERGIYEHSTALAQALKAVSEVGELADAVIKGDRDALKDAIGDVMVCLVGVAKMSGCNIEIQPSREDEKPEGAQTLAAIAAYYVADLASDIGVYDGRKAFHEDSLDESIIHLALVAKGSDLTLLECCESAWYEIK